ncbi:thermonuclease family protein [Vogesella oryzae]|uniref:thermonuclease family protein n=1 Tax=Vogesella oryzae TaxID=1735285 RepID=UPI001581D812|nr:thermonuclease family protein [Vogesella oryzae]
MRYWMVLLLALIYQPVLAAPATTNCRVVAVLDGDTLKCLSNWREITVRLGQIDAPEKSQSYGQRAKYALAARVFGRDVTLQRQEQDKYGRLVAKVLLDGADINLQQVRAGWAWVYRQYAREAAYYAAEREARSNLAGLWQEAAPVPPWEWRRGVRVGRTPQSPAKAPAESRPQDASDGANWVCGSKQRCSQMQSCDEARYHLQVCGVARLDANKDGVPCEALCH